MRGWPSDALPASWALLAAALVGACAPEGESAPSFSFFLDDAEVQWAAVNAWRPSARVVFDTRVPIESAEGVLELYDGSAPVPIPGVARLVGSDEHATRVYTELVYDLSALPDGEFTLVHSRSSVPEGLMPRVSWAADGGGAVPVPRFGDGVPWGTFEGEDALVTVVSRRLLGELDGGGPRDAGTP